MLISVKIRKSIESEVKVQKSLLKALEVQEKNYNVDLGQQKEDISKSLEYYEKVLKEAA